MKDAVFAASRIEHQGMMLQTARLDGQDVIMVEGERPVVGLAGGRSAGPHTVYPATYDNMLLWERTLAPRRRLIAINKSGHPFGFGAGNRIVLSTPDVPGLGDPTTFGGWDGIYAGMRTSLVPFWWIQQSIVRELIPDGVDPKLFPGIGHTGGYGPREFLRAGLFALASLGGYAESGCPVGADADHAIITGYDEESLQRSLAFNKLAMSESCDYTKFTVDTSGLFGFPVGLSAADERRLSAAFAGRVWTIAGAGAGGEPTRFTFDDAEIVRPRAHILARLRRAQGHLRSCRHDHSEAARSTTSCHSMRRRGQCRRAICSSIW